MKLVSEKNLEKNNYEVIFSIEEIQEDEMELFSDFGDQYINVGGELVETDEFDVETVLWALGDSFKKIPSDFPLTKVFSQAQYGSNAEKIANAYAESVTKKVQEIIEELKDKQDSFSGTTEVML